MEDDRPTIVQQYCMPSKSTFYLVAPPPLSDLSRTAAGQENQGHSAMQYSPSCYLTRKWYLMDLKLSVKAMYISSIVLSQHDMAEVPLKC